MARRHRRWCDFSSKLAGAIELKKPRRWRGKREMPTTIGVALKAPLRAFGGHRCREVYTSSLIALASK